MCGEGRASAAPVRICAVGLRQARRHGAQLFLRPRSRVPARLARRAAGNRRRDGRSTIRCSSCGSRSASSTCSRCIPPRAGYTRWMCVCGRAARAACSSRTSRRSPSISRRRPGPGSTRRCSMRARSPVRRSCGREFESVRIDALRNDVRRDTLRDEVRDHARAHAQGAVAAPRPGEFDIKQDAGGVADIEFLAQYWALLWAKDESAGGDVLGHHPAAGVGGFRGPGAAGDGGRAHERVPGLSHALPSPVAGTGASPHRA